MSNFKQISKILSDFENKFKRISINKEKSVECFKNKILIMNKQTGEMFPLKHNPQSVQKNNYLWNNFNSIKMSSDYSNSDYVGVFLTLTLPSEFHPFKNKLNHFNPQFLNKFGSVNFENFNKSISNGYNLLNDSFRDIYKNFRIDRSPVQVKFSRVIEPHKSFVPHLHSVLFVEKDKLDKFLKHINNIIDLYKLGTQSKIEIIENISKTSSYLLKYVRKTQNPQSDKFFHILNGWKKTNKIRSFTQSNVNLKKYIFNKIISHSNKKFNNISIFLKENIIDVVEKNCNINIKYTDKNITYNTKNHISETNLFNVSVEVERYKSLVSEKVQYRVKNFVLTDKDNKILYDKSKYICFNFGKPIEFKKPDQIEVPY